MIKKTPIALVLLFLLAPAVTVARDAVRVLTPTDDTCRAFTDAMVSGDNATALGGWFIGFLSGVAQSTGVDFLRKATVQQLGMRLYNDCQRQPNKALSLAAEEIARELLDQATPKP
jgi:hypothetical protein